MLKYKIDVPKALKEKGYHSGIIRKNKLLSESTLQRLRHGDTGINLDSLNAICVMLRCTPNDVLEVVVTDEEKVKYF